MMNWLVLVGIIATMVLAAVLLKGKLVKWLHYLRGKLHVESLRQAINDADADKEKTGRKNIVILNTASGSFEPAQKQLLKFLAAKGKSKNNGKQTKGRKKFAKPVKRKMDSEQVKQIEKKSLYVTN